MTRGGHREKAGRKSTWKSGFRYEETKLIRVPIQLAEKLLEIAHKLDSGESFGPTSEQLSLPVFDYFSSTQITSSTRLSGSELARRLGVTSAAFTPVWKRGDEAFAQYAKAKDPDGIAWVRDDKKYRPLIQGLSLLSAITRFEAWEQKTLQGLCYVPKVVTFSATLLKRMRQALKAQYMG